MAFRLSGSYTAPWDLLGRGDVHREQRLPLRIDVPGDESQLRERLRVELRRRPRDGRAQTAFLSDRGDERLPPVRLLDLRVSRAFNFAGNRRIVPQFDLFNVTNSYTPTSVNGAVGST